MDRIEMPKLTHKICNKDRCDACMKEGHYLIDYLCRATGESSASYHEGEYDKWLKERNIETSREGWWSHEAFDIGNITGYVLSQRKPTLYTILPLEWKKRGDGSWQASFLNEYYEVKEWKGFKDASLTVSTPDAINPCTSIEDGKAQAEAHYREQLGKCLEVYNG